MKNVSYCAQLTRGDYAWAEDDDSYTLEGVWLRNDGASKLGAFVFPCKAHGRHKIKYQVSQPGGTAQPGGAMAEWTGMQNARTFPFSGTGCAMGRLVPFTACLSNFFPD